MVRLAYGPGMTRRRATTSLGLLSILVAVLTVPGLADAGAAAPPKKPKVSVGDVSVTETDAAGVVASFDVTLSKGVGKKVKVWWATATGTGSTADFTSASGKLVFKGPQAKQTKQVQVAVSGDDLVEADETFEVVLTKVKRAKVKKGTGTATIKNDDAGHTLTVAPTGNGTGTVTSSPAGISCPVDCSEVFTHGSMVTLTATADNSSLFTGWTGGGCSGTSTCTVDMTTARTVSAEFSPAFTLTTAANGGNGTGTVTSNPAGINCGVDCSEKYLTNQQVTLTPAAATGSTFTGWSGACTGTGSCVVTMNAAKSVTASFTLQQFTLTVGTQQNGGSDGKVTGPGISCGVGTPNDCTEIYNYGTVVHLTASAGSGFTPTGWTGACAGQAAASCNLTVTSNTSTSAVFNSL